MKTLAGECLCGGVRYSVENTFRYALNCHCSRCRRATGAAFKSFAGIERSKLQVLAGEGALLIHGDSKNHDAQCGTCGGFLDHRRPAATPGVAVRLLAAAATSSSATPKTA
jgi:hypothetical protein